MMLLAEKWYKKPYFQPIAFLFKSHFWVIVVYLFND